MGSIYCSKIQKHVNHHAYDARGVISVFIKGVPFKDNENNHISKNTPEKDNLRKKFKVKVKCSVKMNAVSSFKQNTNSHLRNSKYDSNFHFQRVKVS